MTQETTSTDNRLSGQFEAHPHSQGYLLSALYARAWEFRNKDYRHPHLIIGPRSSCTWINRMLAIGLRYRWSGYEALYAAALNLLAPTAESDGLEGDGTRWIWRFRILQDNGRSELAMAFLDAGLKSSLVLKDCNTLEEAWQAFISSFENLSAEFQCQLLAGDIIDYRE